jgi:nitroreductase
MISGRGQCLKTRKRRRWEVRWTNGPTEAEIKQLVALFARKDLTFRYFRKSWRANSIDNLGGFQIIDPMRNWIVAAERFNFTADDVIEFCADYEKRGWSEPQ